MFNKKYIILEPLVMMTPNFWCHKYKLLKITSTITYLYLNGAFVTALVLD